MVCGKEFHGACSATPSCINCGGRHVATDKKKCIVYEYNLNLKKAMADGNISIHEAKRIVRRPNLHRDIEWHKELSPTQEEVQKIRELADKRRRAWYMKENYITEYTEQRSFAEIAGCSSTNKERGNNEDERTGDSLRLKKSNPEKESDNVRDRDNYGLEVEVSSPRYANLTTVAHATRYLSEDLKKVYKVLERGLKMMDERLERYEERQLRLQEGFFEKLLHNSRAIKEKEIMDKGEGQEIFKNKK